MVWVENLFSHWVVSDSTTPWTAASQASLSFTISQSLLKLLSIELVVPSNHLFFSISIIFHLIILSSVIPFFSCLQSSSPSESLKIICVDEIAKTSVKLKTTETLKDNLVSFFVFCTSPSNCYSKQSGVWEGGHIPGLRDITGDIPSVCSSFMQKRIQEWAMVKQKKVYSGRHTSHRQRMVHLRWQEVPEGRVVSFL